MVECGRKSKYPNEKKIGINRAGVTLIWYKQKGHFRSIWRFLSVTNNIFIVLPRVCVCVCVHARARAHTQLFVTPGTEAHQVPLTMGFPREEYWGGLPFPSLRNQTCIGRQILYHRATWEALPHGEKKKNLSWL